MRVHMCIYTIYFYIQPNAHKRVNKTHIIHINIPSMDMSILFCSRSDMVCFTKSTAPCTSRSINNFFRQVSTTLRTKGGWE
ncbi:hypothetical protein EON63_05405 [archaeon]|nr:MAG: hypothetical protein EON63_05405 [archaeon]